MQKIKKFSLFFLINILAVLWTLLKNYEEFSLSELVLFSLYVFVVVAVQAGIVFALKDKPAKIAAALFAAFNLHTLILINDPNLIKLPMLGDIGVIAVVAAGLWVVLNIKEARMLNIFALIMIGMTVLQFGIETIKIDSFRPLPAHFKIPTFKTHPNIYVITFDAMSPEMAVKANLGVDTLYTDKVQKYGGRVVKNAFAERISTKWSLNSFQAMDLDYFEGLKKQNVFIMDRVANPLYTILRQNDYKIQFMYVSSFFGDDRGRLDFYGVAQGEGMCMHLDKAYALAGYCMPLVQNAIKAMNVLENKPYPQYLFDRIKTTAKSGEPWYTQAHIYTPGHTPNSFNPKEEEDWVAFRKRYKERNEEARGYLEELLKTLKEYDPSAILIVFGDHGPITSRDMLGDNSLAHYALDYDPSVVAADSLLSYKQIVQDRHGIYLAVFPRTFCTKEFNRNPYSSVRIMRDVVKCLSGEDPLPAHFQPNDDKWKPFSYQ